MAKKEIRDLYQELRSIGLTSDQCCEVLDWTEKLPIKILGVNNTKVSIMQGVITVEPNEQKSKQIMEISQKARLYAIECHNSVNQKYDIYAYSFHLQMVVDVANKFIHLIPEEKRDIVIAGCWVHDVIEDTRQTYNDVKKVLGLEVAEIAYALTNEKGRNRDERANDKYYDGIKNTPYASFVKICDRIANANYSYSRANSMYLKYFKENKKFQSALFRPVYEEMFDYLDKEVFKKTTKIEHYRK